MESISIVTSQNVNLSYRLAGVGPRVLAMFLDSIFKYSYYFILYMIAFNTILRNGSGSAITTGDGHNQFLIGVFIVLSLPGLLYHFLCETFMNGQSFGKKLVRLKVVKLDGSRPNVGSYLIRSMFRIIDDGLIGIIAIAASSKAQRLGDMIAGTTVVELGKAPSIKDTILNQHQGDHKITYQQVALLSDKDAAIIKEVLEFAAKQQKPEHLTLLAEKIRAKYGIIRDERDDERFLATLLQDYTYYQFEK